MQLQGNPHCRRRLPWRSLKAALGFVGGAGLLVMAGCYTPERPFPDLPRLTVATQFKTENLCDIGISPAIFLSGVPNGTASYLVQITDVNVLIETPWREVIPLSSQSEIPEGAAKTYIGPCLGDNLRFAPVAPTGYLHRVEVLAENQLGQPLAYGSTFVYIESPYLTAKKERLQQQQGGSTMPPGSAAPPSLPSPQGGPFSGTPYSSGATPDLGVFR